MTRGERRLAEARARNQVGTVKLKVNGEAMDVDPGTTVAVLLERLGVGRRRVAVAVNGEVAPRSEHSRRVLRDGDAVEVIQAVAGG